MDEIIGDEIEEEYIVENWYKIETNGNLEKELKREVSKGHPLYKKNVIAIARKEDCDDVLFVVKDNIEKVAKVHLTWTNKNIEGFPKTKIYESIEEWIKEEEIKL